jgi:conjugal transfer pilus assembly protein TraV
MILRLLAAVSACAIAAGCANLSGLDATSELDCKAPVGLKCTSLSQTHAIAKAGQLPARAASPGPATRAAADEPERMSMGAQPPARRYYAADRQAPSVQFSTPAPMATASSAVPGAIDRTSPADMNAPSTGTPLRTPERVLRIWIAPFQDTDGDLHDQRYLYVTITPGQWTLEAARAAVQSAYRVVRPLSRPDAVPTASSEPTSGRPAASPASPQVPQSPLVAPGAQRPSEEQ